MNSNFKRRLLAGLFVPVIGLAAGTVLGQSSTSPATTGTTSMGGAAGSASWNAQTFDLLDKNRDGRISREEAQADPSMRNSWTKMDATNRGSISKEDFEKYRTMQPGATGAAGTSPAPNSGTATLPTHPASPSSGSPAPNSGNATPPTHPAVAPSGGSPTTK